jgi:hypothetical protein
MDRALVLRDRSGIHHLLGPRHRHGPLAAGQAFEPGTTAKGATAFGMGLRGYDSAFLVQLDEQPGTRAVALPTPYGTESVDIQVLWWVHDPVQIVRTRTTHGWLPVRKNLDRRLRHLKDEYAAGGHSLGTPEIMQHLSEHHELGDCGLTYRVTDISAREDNGELRLGELGGAGLPNSWNDKSREEYEFCIRKVKEGPVSLAALWLVRHPDQVSQVLDWSVKHSSLIREETDWQDEVAGLLGKLTEQEKQELSELLRDRLFRLGRQVPEQRGSAEGRESAPFRANDWAGGLAKGQPV